VEDVKVNVHASESSPVFARFTTPPGTPIDKKGEKAQALFLINAGPASSKAIDQENTVIARSPSGEG